MALVSASMIVRNEAERLGAALGSLSSLACLDEIVVVDTGSTDGTQDIARQFGARVHEQPWQDDFAFHRNHCLELCRNDWLLILDGDEELTDPGNLDSVLAAPDGDAVLVRVDCTAAGTGQVEETLYSVRAFDRRAARWKYPIHNQLVGVREPVASTASIRAWYDADTHETTERRLQVLLDHYEREPSVPHYAYYITHAHRVLGRMDGVLTWGDRYFDVAEPDDARGAVICAFVVQAHLALGDMDRAMRVLSLGLQRYPGYADLHHLHLSVVAQQWYAAVRDPLPRFLHRVGRVARSLLRPLLRLPQGRSAPRTPAPLRDRAAGRRGDRSSST